MAVPFLWDPRDIPSDLLRDGFFLCSWHYNLKRTTKDQFSTPILPRIKSGNILLLYGACCVAHYFLNFSLLPSKQWPHHLTGKSSKLITILWIVLFFYYSARGTRWKKTTKASKVVHLNYGIFIPFRRESVSMIKRKGSSFLEKTDFHN